MSAHAASAGALREYDGRAPATLTEMLAATATRSPAGAAFVDEQRSIDWATLATEVEALAGRLAASGVGPGERVALLFGNGIPYVVACWATWRLGAIVVPLNGRLLATEMVPLVQDSEPAVLLAGEPLLEAAEEVAGAAGVALHRATEGGELLGGVASAPVPASARSEPDHPAAIMYTSGTTGRPKGVVVSHRNFVQNARTCVDVIGRRADDVELICVPQFNITGLGSQTIPVVLARSTGILCPRFETSLVLDLVARHHASTAVMAPTMWWRLLEDPAFATADTSSLRLVLFGGAPMPTALLERMRAAFPDATFGNGYGLTETCSMVTYIGGDELLTRLDSVGRALPITDVRVVDPATSSALPAGRTGELWFRGAQVGAGYWRNAEATAAVFEDGWLRSGDAGRLDDEGFLYLQDRLKDVIKRAGESVYCFEVENVLAQHDAVLEAAVIGVPDEIYGERVAAVVACKPGTGADAEVLRAFCRERLARFKVPDAIAFVDALPRNAGGKVLKRQLPELVRL